MLDSIRNVLPRRGASRRRLVDVATIVVGLIVLPALSSLAFWSFHRAPQPVAGPPWQFAPGFYVPPPVEGEETLLVWDGQSLDPWLHLHNGRAHYLKKDFDASYLEFSAAIADDPSLALAYWYRGLIHRYWKNEAAAQVEFELAQYHDEGLFAPAEFSPDFVEPGHFSLP
jgi:hypothetical protein